MEMSELDNVSPYTPTWRSSTLRTTLKNSRGLRGGRRPDEASLCPGAASLRPQVQKEGQGRLRTQGLRREASGSEILQIL